MSILVLGIAEQTRADVSPSGCNSNELNLSLERSHLYVKIGQTVWFTVSIENCCFPSGCDINDTEVTLTLPALDGTATGDVNVLETGGVFPIDGSGDTTYDPVPFMVAANPGVTLLQAQADADGQLRDRPDGFGSATASKTIPIIVIDPNIEITKRADPCQICGEETEVTYTYELTNTGDVDVRDVVVTDENCTPVRQADDPGNDDTILDTGETWVFTCTTMISEDTINTVTAEGNDVLLSSHVDAEAQAVVNACSPPPQHGATIGKICETPKLIGDKLVCDITITYDDDFGDTLKVWAAWDEVDPLGSSTRVPTAGNLAIVAVFGNTTATVAGPLPALIGPAGSTLNGLPGTASDGAITFRAEIADAYVIQAGDPNPLEDRGHVDVNDLCDDPETSACTGSMNSLSFTSSTVIIDPDIKIEEDPNRSNICEGADTLVSWTYTVTNPGDVDLFEVVVWDDECDLVQYVSGDTGDDGILGTSEIWIYECNDVISSGVTSTATVTANDVLLATPVEDSNDATVLSDAPTCDDIIGDTEPDCDSTGNVLSVLVSGGQPPYGYSWSVSGHGSWTIDGGSDTNEITYTAGAPGTSAVFGVDVNDAFDCSVVCMIELDCNSIPTFSILTPNGGEVLIAGATYDINWTTTDNINDVKIEYSTNNGTDWNDVNTVPNTGSYDWFVPEVTSNQCIVQISDANDANLYDISDDVFTIYVCRAGYDFVTKWGEQGDANGQFDYPYGIAVDSSAYIYVSDKHNDRIQKFTSDGNFVKTWGSIGIGDEQLNLPTHLDVGPSGYVYVADTLNYRIQKFDSNGGSITRWGSSGSGDGQFNRPCGVAVDCLGNVYVADTWNDRIQKFEPNDGDPNIYDFVTKWGTTGTGNSEFLDPYSIAVDCLGNVYVADYTNNRIQQFDSNGNFLTKWGSAGYGDGQFTYPLDISVDSAAYVYVTDSCQRAQKFTSDGMFITKWGSNGSGDGQFDGLHGIAIDSSGNVFVTELWPNQRVQKFEPEGPLRSDLNNDCQVDFVDFAVTASEWLECGNPFDSNCGY
jgi:hypothetical protein